MSIDWISEESHPVRPVGVFAVVIEMPTGGRYWCKAFWDAKAHKWDAIAEPLRGPVVAFAKVELPQ